MARYIDVDRLNYTMASVYWGKDNKGRDIYRRTFVAFQSDVDEIPTADVVPKSEVVRCKDCIFYKNHPNGLCYAWTEPCDNKRGYKGEVHCVEEDDFCSFAELKKKYTEGEK